MALAGALVDGGTDGSALASAKIAAVMVSHDWMPWRHERAGEDRPMTVRRTGNAPVASGLWNAVEKC